jgi:hypothetical protein
MPPPGMVPSDMPPPGMEYSHERHPFYNEHYTEEYEDYEGEEDEEEEDENENDPDIDNMRTDCQNEDFNTQKM